MILKISVKSQYKVKTVQRYLILPNKDQRRSGMNGGKKNKIMVTVCSQLLKAEILKRLKNS